MSTVLITGASRGIGRAAARRFALAGWNTVVGYHTSEQEARALEAELTDAGAAVLALRADLRERTAADELVQKAQVRFGALDALVLCAGVAHSALFQDTGEEDWARLFEVNLGGTRRCIRAALPGMLARKSGRIVTVSSVWGITGASCEAAYSASKAALIGLTKALAKELGPSGIAVNCVAPGVIDTDMNAALDDEARADLCAQTPMGRLGTPEEAAEAIFFLSSPRAGFVTGQILSPNGGFLI